MTNENLFGHVPIPAATLNQLGPFSQPQWRLQVAASGGGSIKVAHGRFKIEGRTNRQRPERTGLPRARARASISRWPNRGRHRVGNGLGGRLRLDGIKGQYCSAGELATHLPRVCPKSATWSGDLQ